MSVIFILIPLSIVMAGCFLVGFIWAVRSGQYEDTCTPSMRVLLDDMAESNAKPPSPLTQEQRACRDISETGTHGRPPIVSIKKPSS